MAFNILEAVLSSGWGCASLDREAWKNPKYSAEERARGGGLEGKSMGTSGPAGLRRELGEETNQVGHSQRGGPISLL